MSKTPVPLTPTATLLAPAVRLSDGVAGGVQPWKQVLAPASVVQAMPWRLKAANRLQECGVPLVRLPSSSSTARMAFHHEPVAQPFEVKVVPVVQEKARFEVERVRYQSRSRVVQAEPVPGFGRSRLARSQIASDPMWDSQWTSR